MINNFSLATTYSGNIYVTSVFEITGSREVTHSVTLKYFCFLQKMVLKLLYLHNPVTYCSTKWQEFIIIL